jgi:sulfite exporter TauE/SafE
MVRKMTPKEGRVLAYILVGLEIAGVFAMVRIVQILAMPTATITFGIGIVAGLAILSVSQFLGAELVEWRKSTAT